MKPISTLVPKPSSPLLPIMEVSARRVIRPGLTVGPRRQLAPRDRATLRAQRHAEMLAWEASGGDVARADAVHPEAFGAKILLT